ncbi:MAG TPA: translocation/assembly module TamB domain-containing protein, partial [Nitrospiria bacterium]|nr:translocation/assembly module TamB domain-containing protein [Nitrospiria bacterium]
IPLRLEVFGLDVGPPDAPLLLLSSGSVSLNPLPLLFHRLTLSRITLERPRVDLIQTEGGWNLPRFSGGGGGWSVVVEKIVLRGGAIRVRMPPSGRSVSLERIDLTLAPDLTKRRWKAVLNAGAGEWTEPNFTQKIDRLSFDGSVAKERAEIRRLRATIGGSSVEASGAILDLSSGLGGVVLELEARGDIKSEDLPGLSAKVRGRLLAEAKIRGKLSQIDIDGKGSLNSLVYENGPVDARSDTRLGGVRLDWRYRRGKDLVATVSGTLFDGPVTATLAGDDPLQKHFSYRGEVQFGKSRLMPFLRIVLDRPMSGYPDVEAAGEIRVSGTGFDPSTLLAEGKVSVRGPGKRGRSDLPQTVAWVGLLQSGEAAFRFERGVIYLQTLRVSTPKSLLTGEGRVSREVLDLNLSVSSDSLSEWGPVAGGLLIGGSLAMRGSVSGPTNDPEVKGTVSAENLSVKDFGPGRFHGKFHLIHRRLILQENVLDVPPASRYLLRGEVDLARPEAPLADLTVTLAPGDPGKVLSAFYRPLPVALPAEGTIRFRGGVDRFDAGGELRLENGNLFGQEVERGEFRFDADTTGVRLTRFILRNGQSFIAGSAEVRRSGTLVVRTVGRVGNPKEVTALIGRPLRGSADLVLAAEGEIRSPVLAAQVRFNRVSYGESALGSGTLSVRTEGSKWLASAVFEQRGLTATAKAEATSPYPWELSLQASNVEVAPFLSRGLKPPPGTSLTVSLRAQLQGEGKSWDRLSGVVDASRLRADVEGVMVENRAPLVVRLDRGKLTVDAFDLIGEGTRISLSGSAVLFERIDLTARGEADLRLLTLFTPSLRGDVGTVSLTVRATDRWDAPEIRGEVTLRQGLVEILPIRQTLLIENATVLLSEKQIVLETFDGRLGEGRVRAMGEAGLDHLRIGAFRFIFEGEHLTMQPSPHLSVTFSNRLLFRGEGEVREIRGEVDLERAVYKEEITVQTLLARFGRKPEAVPTPTPFIGGARLQVAVFGRERIMIDTNLAKISLMVDLSVRGTYDQPVVLGRIEALEGDLVLQQRKLKIDSGAIDFSNAQRTEPRISLTAHAQVREYEIDLDLSGTPDQINMKLSSTPSLPENDILSLLAVGKTTAELTGGGGNYEASQAAALALETLFSGKIEEAIGVERFQIGPYEGRGSSGSETRLTVEKRVFDERLTVIFSTSLTTATDELIRFEYEVNPNVFLIGERDELGQIGGDIKLTFRFQ